MRATGSAAASRGHRRLPFRAPAAARRSPRHRPLHRPVRPPLDGGRGGQPDPGAAGLWPTAILQACLAAPLTYLPAPCGRRWADLFGGEGAYLHPPTGSGPRAGTPPPPVLGLPPLLLLRCGDVEPQPGPKRVPLANVTSLRLHWHTVADWRADVVLITETRLMAVVQRVMRAQAGASGWQAFWGAFLESRGGGTWDAPAGGLGNLVRQGIPARQVLPPKGAPRTEPYALAQTLWHSTRWCQVLTGLGRGADTLHAQAAYGVSAQPALNRAFRDHATQYVARHGTAPQLVGGDFNFDLNSPLRAPPSVLASLLMRWLADADLELATALGRHPLCAYHGPEGTRPSHIDRLLVDTRLAALLHAAERLPQGAISGHTPVCFDIHLKGRRIV